MREGGEGKRGGGRGGAAAGGGGEARQGEGGAARAAPVVAGEGGRRGWREGRTAGGECACGRGSGPGSPWFPLARAYLVGQVMATTSSGRQRGEDGVVCAGERGDERARSSSPPWLERSAFFAEESRAAGSLFVWDGRGCVAEREKKGGVVGVWGWRGTRAREKRSVVNGVSAVFRAPTRSPFHSRPSVHKRIHSLSLSLALAPHTKRVPAF